MRDLRPKVLIAEDHTLLAELARSSLRPNSTWSGLFITAGTSFVQRWN